MEITICVRTFGSICSVRELWSYSTACGLNDPHGYSCTNWTLLANSVQFPFRAIQFFVDAGFDQLNNIASFGVIAYVHMLRPEGWCFSPWHHSYGVIQDLSIESSTHAEAWVLNHVVSFAALHDLSSYETLCELAEMS